MSSAINKEGQPYRRYKVQPPCGTNSGYDYHVRQALESPCSPCSEAHSIHWKLQRVKRKKEISEWRRANSSRYLVTRAEKLKENGVEEFTMSDVLEKWGSNCHICDYPINLDAHTRAGEENWEWSLHLDHVVSVFRGGSHTLENCRPAHAVCNIRKSKKEWTDELKQRLKELVVTSGAF
jgi:5-methylcytosine-specific restriction endonuclease McrA